VAPAGPISADEVARKTFPSSFRGFDPDQVRVFLGQVAAELAALQERERLLIERVAAAEAKAAQAEAAAEAAVASAVPPEPGEAELMAALGREAGRVLAAAKEAGAEIRSTAEKHASRVHREAREEASRLRAEAERVAETRAAEAEALADALRADAEEAAAETRAEAELQAQVTVEGAADRGREMVKEAQAVRERILRDLARRRRTAHQQLEQLRAGRERLLETYAVARSIMDEATAELAVAEVEARGAAEAAALQLEEPEPTIEEMEAEVVAMREAPPEEAEVERPPEDAPPPAAEGAPDEPLDAEQPAASSVEPKAPVLDLREQPPSEPVATVGERRTSALRILRPAEPEPSPAPPEHGEAPAAVATEEAPDRPAVDEVFARLRADVAVPEQPAPEEPEPAAVAEPQPEADAGAEEPEEAEEAEEPEEPEADDADALRRRDADLAPVEKELSRALKRELADDQNAVLDALRRSRSRPTLGDLLPELAAAAARYAEAATGPLRDAAAAGRAAVAADAADLPPVDDLAAGMGAEVAGALRKEVATALEATGGDHAGAAERISGAYRSWKGSLAEPLARATALAAEARGRLTTEAPVRWLTDPATQACADCAQNAGADPRRPGEPFPSGVASPPAHVGCRCLIEPADR
jgi:DivIVA domain-containing protein